MPVKLRLRRQGRKKSPHYAIVAADARAPRDGKFIEKIGYYNPVTEPARVYMDHELAIKWLRVGAQPTHTVRALLRHSGVTLKFALIKQGKSDEEMDRIFTRWINEKQNKKKKKMVMIDIHGHLLEDLGDVVPAKNYTAPKAIEEAAPVVEESEAAPVETPVAEETETTAPAAEATEGTAEEAAPEAEAVPEAEATPAAEEASATEEKKEEAPAAE